MDTAPDKTANPSTPIETPTCVADNEQTCTKDKPDTPIHGNGHAEDVSKADAKLSVSANGENENFVEKSSSTVVNNDAKQSDDAACKVDTAKLGKVSSKANSDGSVNASKSGRIIRQVEYYFSDSNLVRDKFMTEQSKANEGWFEAKTLLKFNRLAALITDENELMTILAESKSGLLELDHEKIRIRRSLKLDPPVTTKEQMRQRTYTRTVFVDGFSKDEKANDIIDYFIDMAHTNDIQLRKKLGSKDFLGSVFVVFATEEAAKTFAENESEYKGVKLTTMMLDELKKQRSVALSEPSNKDKIFNKMSKELNKGEELAEMVEKRMIKGSVLKLEGLPASCTRETLKDKFNDHGRAYADFNRGDSTGWLRFSVEGEAKTVLESVLKDNDSKLEFEGGIVPTSYKVLEGEEEMEYWKGVVQKLSDRNKKGNNRGRGFKRKRRNDWGDDGKSSKIVKS